MVTSGLILYSLEALIQYLIKKWIIKYEPKVRSISIVMIIIHLINRSPYTINTYHLLLTDSIHYRTEGRYVLITKFVDRLSLLLGKEWIANSNS
jgi:hypothetical protein